MDNVYSDVDYAELFLGIASLDHRVEACVQMIMELVVDIRSAQMKYEEKDLA